MVREAQSFADKDKKRAEQVEARNKAESLCFEAERLLKELGSKATADERKEIEAKVAGVREELAKKEPSGLKEKADDLTQSIHKLSTRLYQAGREGGTAGSAPPTEEATAEEGTAPEGEEGPKSSGPGKKGAVDADFKVVDDKGSS